MTELKILISAITVKNGGTGGFEGDLENFMEGIFAFRQSGENIFGKK